MNKFVLWLLLFALCLPAFAQVALVGHTSSGYGASPPINTTGASLYAVCSIRTGASQQPIDSSGNTYTLAAQQSGYFGNAALWVAYAPATSTSETFQDGGGGGPIAAMAFSGIASGPDQTQGTTGASPLTVPSVTPTKGYEAVLSCLGPATESSGGTSVISVSPLTFLDTGVYTGGATTTISSAYDVQPSTPAASSPIWTVTNNSGTQIEGVQATFFSNLAPATLATGITTLPTGNLTVAYPGGNMAISGGVQPYTCSLAAGTLPPGLSVTGNCSTALNGTPTTTGTYPGIQIKVTDHASNTVTSPSLSTTVYNAPPTITTTSLPNGTQLTAYVGATLAGTCGNPPCTWSYDQSVQTPGGYHSPYDTIPEGMALSTSGALTSSYINGQGIYQPEFLYTDSTGAQATAVIPISITGNNTFGGAQLFPSDSIFHMRVDSLPLDTSPVGPIWSDYASVALVPYFGQDASSGGMPINTVSASQALVSVSCVSGNCGQYDYTEAPLGPNLAIEGTPNDVSLVPGNYWGDGHMIAVQLAGDGNPAQGWEMDGGEYNGGPYLFYSNAYYNYSSYTPNAQGYGATDAAGLPVGPLLLNYDEVLGTGTPGHENGVVQHPIRFTMNETLEAHVFPAASQAGIGSGNCTGAGAGTGYNDPTGNDLLSQINPPNGSSCTGQPNPMGEIYRLPKTVSIPTACSSNAVNSIIVTALQDYGIIIADNGHTGALIGSNDPRWPSYSTLDACLGSFTLGQFVAVNVQGQAVLWPGNDTAHGQLGSYQVTTSSSPVVQVFGRVTKMGSQVIQ